MSTATDTKRDRLYLELVEARTDAHNLSDVALPREARLAGIRELGARHETVEAVARAWVGMPTVSAMRQRSALIDALGGLP